MTYTLLRQFSIEPGQAVGLNDFFPPTSKVIVGIDAARTEGATILAYAEVIVVGDGGPIGGIIGRAESFIMNDRAAYIGPRTYTQQLGGWFLRVYAVKRSNGVPFNVLVYVEP